MGGAPGEVPGRSWQEMEAAYLKGLEVPGRSWLVVEEAHNHGVDVGGVNREWFRGPHAYLSGIDKIRTHALEEELRLLATSLAAEIDLPCKVW